jgi:hypothetical protein
MGQHLQQQCIDLDDGILKVCYYLRNKTVILNSNCKMFDVYAIEITMADDAY